MDGDELVEALRTAAASALPALPVIFAYLYGSRTGDRSRPDSDVDVGIAVADDVEIWAAELDRDLLAAIADGRR